MHDLSPSSGGSGEPAPAAILVLRAPSGLSGDMFVAGLCRMAGLDAAAVEALVARLGVPQLAGALRVVPRSVSGISGYGCEIRLPHVHRHATMADIRELIGKSGMSRRGGELALAAFEELARAEAAVHGVAVEAVAFHEVGALDSILDVCLSAELFALIGPSRFVCGPLPVSDGVVACAHGLLSTPAPATLALLEGMPVYGIPGAGETVTPTAAALLRAFQVEFGDWPAMVLTRQARAFGTRIIPGVPNGAVFALGEPSRLGRPDIRDGRDRAGDEGDAPHSHEHSHAHPHEHSHDHAHEHSHARPHAHAHEHSHDHPYEHSHARPHAHAHEHSHDHAHEHSHARPHDHVHDHGHDQPAVPTGRGRSRPQ
ncbi:LarC family nickel insertion protein [Desulfolutivibrio sulfoxidireducens]|uniref:LarC family nickel insertion protein n=1 Tax=Desulfolutivibrio sulfoxidireducens TaxID=2773299 RepID=UPI00159D7F8C|nr:LarC family nickel insertion protein [Desulfolutivibrio sulfoxidireducens]QLA15972.1 DUF111 family protein [Desulfolutivibrio sulfoxidireducens]